MASMPALAGGVVVLALAGGAVVFACGLHAGPPADVAKLTGQDFGSLRRQALVLFPRGLPIADAARGLVVLGFKCTPARHLIANINAPSVECDSAGRGYPNASRTQITVMARNGTVSDIAVGNGFDTFQADARTPDPEPKGPADLASNPMAEQAAAK